MYLTVSNTDAMLDQRQLIFPPQVFFCNADSAWLWYWLVANSTGKHQTSTHTALAITHRLDPWTWATYNNKESDTSRCIKGEPGSLVSTRISAHPISCSDVLRQSHKYKPKIQNQMQMQISDDAVSSDIRSVWLLVHYDRPPSCVLCQSYPSTLAAPYASVATKSLFCSVSGSSFFNVSPPISALKFHFSFRRFSTTLKCKLVNTWINKI